MPYVEVVPDAALLGRVTTVERGGRRRRLDTPRARRSARAIVAVAPFLSRLLPLGLRLRRAWRAARRA